MSQIICEECGKSIEISVSRCPYCGCPLEAMLCNEKITTQENVADKLCKICGSKLKEGVISCSVCGWDGIHKYKRPFGDKENFDQQLFDSIQIPKKPPSAIKAFIIASVPVLALLPIGLEALWFEPVAIVVYLILRSKTKEWGMDNKQF